LSPIQTPDRRPPSRPLVRPSSWTSIGVCT